MKNLIEFGEKYEQALTNLNTEFKELFNNETKVLFEKYTWLKEISWTQYTPYFNDGDTCEFNVSEECAINGTTYFISLHKGNIKIWDESYSSVLYNEEEVNKFIELVLSDKQIEKEYIELSDIMVKIMTFLSSKPEIALSLFGDHIKVSIQESGAYTESYEHE